MKLLLGSQSPRRKELLGGLGCKFECRTADTEEIMHILFYGMTLLNIRNDLLCGNLYSNFEAIQ